MKAVAKKIAELTVEIGGLKKDKSDKVNYDFHGYESVSAKLKPLLLKYKLALMPEIDDVKEEYIKVESFGKIKTCIRTIVSGSILVIDYESGESLERKFAGIDQDFGGKSFGQACTEMMKRFELKLFHISTKQDIDPDSRPVEIEDDVKKPKITHEQWNAAIEYAKNADWKTEVIPRLAKYDVDLDAFKAEAYDA